MKRSVTAGGRPLEYTLIQTVRANVLLQALPEGVILVYAPRTMRLRDIDELVRQRADQLQDMQRQVDQKLEERRLAHPVADGSPLFIEGVRHILRLRQGGRTRSEIAGGEYRLDGTTMIVSRGLTRHAYGIPRLFNRPELVVIDLLPAEKTDLQPRSSSDRDS